MERGKKMDSLCIVMPAYNEESNIEETVKNWYPILEGKSADSRLVIADSGSTDATHEILINLKNIYPQLDILVDTEKQHGPKVIALYDYAIKKGFDFVFQTDSDGQTNPMEFDAFWNMRNEYDGIFGYRNIRGDGKVRDFVEKVVCFLLKFYFGVNVPDANAPFRLMKTDIVREYLYKMAPDYSLPNIMMTVYFVYYKEKYTFRTISFKSIQRGGNSVNLPKIIKIGVEALGDFRKFKNEMKVEKGYGL